MRPSKRDELVRKSLDIFYRNGFHATGMDMLASETGISKTTMYKYFRTKEELILAALRLRDENFRNSLVRKIEAIGKSPRDKLLAMFAVLGAWFAEDGFQSCMFIKASAEYQDVNDPIHVQSALNKQLIFNYLRDLAEHAGASDPDLLARQLVILKEGAIVMAHFGHTEDPAGDAKTAAQPLVDAAIDG